MKKYIKWCVSHYTIDYCNTIKKELRSQGFKCVTRDYIKEDGKSYARVYIERNEFYELNRKKAVLGV